MLSITRVFRGAYERFRAPDRQPKCYDMTEQERATAIMRLNRNVWNEHQLTQLDIYRENKQ